MAVVTFVPLADLPLAVAKMSQQELSPTLNSPEGLAEQAIFLATDALKNLLRQRSIGPLTKAENDSVETWVGIAQADGFHKGRWLTTTEQEIRRVEGISLSDSGPS